MPLLSYMKQRFYRLCKMVFLEASRKVLCFVVLSAAVAISYSLQTPDKILKSFHNGQLYLFENVVYNPYYEQLKYDEKITEEIYRVECCEKQLNTTIRYATSDLSSVENKTIYLVSSKDIRECVKTTLHTGGKTGFAGDQFEFYLKLDNNTRLKDTSSYIFVELGEEYFFFGHVDSSIFVNNTYIAKTYSLTANQYIDSLQDDEFLLTEEQIVIQEGRKKDESLNKQETRN